MDTEIGLRFGIDDPQGATHKETGANTDLPLFGETLSSNRNRAFTLLTRHCHCLNQETTRG